MGGWIQSVRRQSKKTKQINDFNMNHNRRISMKIQILGTGCPKCKKLAESADAAAKDLQLDYELEKVTDINQIMAFGVMITPALAVDGAVKVVGKVPNIEEIKGILKR
jgi:small redox-active disulfide protein 2